MYATYLVPGLDCKEHWKEDNFCDELNNNVGCDWDGGDCCGPNITTTACTDGTCYPTCTKCECLDPNYQGGISYIFVKVIVHWTMKNIWFPSSNTK